MSNSRALFIKEFPYRPSNIVSKTIKNNRNTIERIIFEDLKSYKPPATNNNFENGGGLQAVRRAQIKDAFDTWYLKKIDTGLKGGKGCNIPAPVLNKFKLSNSNKSAIIDAAFDRYSQFPWRVEFKGFKKPDKSTLFAAFKRENNMSNDVISMFFHANDAHIRRMGRKIYDNILTNNDKAEIKRLHDRLDL